jgi:hypothetical protein
VALLTTFLQKIGFAGAVNDVLGFFKIQQPYSESDHVINIALNTFAGGQTLDDIKLRRQDSAFLEAVQAETIPAPTTSGDFCRRFAGNDVTNLMEAVNRTTNNRAFTRHINSMAACLQKIGESMFLLSEDTSKVG